MPGIFQVPEGVPPIRLFCFPYAGGNAYAYRPLQQQAPHGLVVEGIELPGHGRRTREALCRTLDALAEDVFLQLRDRIIDDRYALFGHSMGAMLAYLCLTRIRSHGLPLPRALFLSGRAAPCIRESRKRHELPRPAFIRMLSEMGGLPPEILQEPGLIDYFEPILRADFEAVDSWQYHPREPLPVPFDVFIGHDDQIPAADAEAWSRETSGQCTLHSFPGNHFFIQQHWTRIAELVGTRLGLSKSR